MPPKSASVDKMQDRLTKPSAVLTFLNQHGFAISAQTDLNNLVKAVLHYCQEFENREYDLGSVSTTHHYPLQQQRLLAANQKEPVEYWVKSSPTDEKYIGRFELDRRTGKISSRFFAKSYSRDDENEFSQFLRFLMHVECHIEGDSKQFAKVPLLTVLRNPSKYPLSKVPFVIEHLKEAFIQFAVMFAITFSLQSTLYFAATITRSGSIHYMNGREVIPLDAMLYYAMMSFVLLIQIVLTAAITNQKTKAMLSVLAPSERSVSNDHREFLSSLKGLKTESMFTVLEVRDLHATNGYCPVQ